MTNTLSKFSVLLSDDIATNALGVCVSAALNFGDTILLTGPLGSGKSHLSRAIIQARIGHDTEVPSPTYTLVQTYADGAGEIWHCDLYRLCDAHEVIELGLDEAFDTALCLIEWPERLPANMRPSCPIEISLCYALDGTSRRAEISFYGHSALAAALAHFQKGDAP